MASSTFSWITAVNFGYMDVVIVNRSFIRNFSFILYGGSLLLTFLLTAMNNSRTQLDYQRAAKKQVEELDRNFDEIGA